MSKYIARDKELDRLYERTYEDSISGKLSNERYAKMTSSYESEQGELAIKIKALRTELEKNAGKLITADMFIGAVRKYTEAKKLSERMLKDI